MAASAPSPDPWHETIVRYGVAPTWEFLAPVVVAVQRGLQLRGKVGADTTWGVHCYGATMTTRLVSAGHQLRLNGRTVCTGDAWQVATLYYALAGWQHAQADALDALGPAAQSVRRWACDDLTGAHGPQEGDAT